MDRFQELEQKGWRNLNGEEREEYQHLKRNAANTVPLSDSIDISVVPQPNANEDRIKRLEEQVARMTQENANLRQETAKLQAGWEEYVPPKDRNKMATIKIYRENAEAPSGVIVKAVVFKNNDWNEETHKYDKLVYTITLRYDDGTTKDMKIDAMQLAQIQEIEKVEIIKEDRRTLRKVMGYVPLPNKDREGYPKRILGGGAGYGTSIGSGQVPLEVFTVKSTVVVKRQNGQEFTMDADYLNL